jgi:alpha-mannosidase
MGGEINDSKPKSSYPQLCSHPVGQTIANIYRDRIGMFYNGGQYERNNLLA